MRYVLLHLASLILLGACAEQALDPAVGMDVSDASLHRGPFVHRVTAGGPDICRLFDLHPGCDGNLSLVVMQWSDGSLTGQGEDAPGDHLDIDCLEVDGSREWVGGTGDDGARWILRLVDAGRSANDPPDSASGRLFGGTDPTLCHRKPRGGLLLPRHPCRRVR